MCCLNFTMPPRQGLLLVWWGVVDDCGDRSVAPGTAASHFAKTCLHASIGAGTDPHGSCSYRAAGQLCRVKSLDFDSGGSITFTSSFQRESYTVCYVFFS